MFFFYIRITITTRHHPLRNQLQVSVLVGKTAFNVYLSLRLQKLLLYVLLVGTLLLWYLTVQLYTPPPALLDPRVRSGGGRSEKASTFYWLGASISSLVKTSTLSPANGV